jgi:hypothetical protein
MRRGLGWRRAEASGNVSQSISGRTVFVLESGQSANIVSDFRAENVAPMLGAPYSTCVIAIRQSNRIAVVKSEQGLGVDGRL